MYKQYNFGDIRNIDGRNPAHKYGYRYKLDLKGNKFRDFLLSCNLTLSRGSTKKSPDWHAKHYKKFKSWMVSSDEYAVFFKNYDDFEQSKMHYVLTME